MVRRLFRRAAVLRKATMARASCPPPGFPVRDLDTSCKESAMKRLITCCVAACIAAANRRGEGAADIQGDEGGEMKARENTGIMSHPIGVIAVLALAALAAGCSADKQPSRR